MTEKELIQLVSSKGLRWVKGRGNPASRLWIVGEAPGADEDQCGFSFVGYSGKEQDKMISEGGLSEPAHFTNPYNIRPPDNKMSRFEELGVPKQLFESNFFQSLSLHQPPIIMTVGETSTKLLLPFTEPKRENKKESFISKWMGSLLVSPFLNYPHYVIPCYHPAYILRSWGDRVVAVLCYAKAVEELEYWRIHGKLRPLPERKIDYNLNPQDLLARLSLILSNSCVSFDIEMLRRRLVYTISFAESPFTAVAYKLWGYDPVVGAKIIKETDRILSSCTLIGQNCTVFDEPWLSSTGFSPSINLTHDIMVRHHILWPELRHRLAFTTMQYTREPYYKDDGRTWSAKDNTKQLLLYNGKDACVTYEVFLAQEEEFNERL